MCYGVVDDTCVFLCVTVDITQRWVMVSWLIYGSRLRCIMVLLLTRRVCSYKTKTRVVIASKQLPVL